MWRSISWVGTPRGRGVALSRSFGPTAHRRARSSNSPARRPSMRSASIGTREASLSQRVESTRRQAGFTLVETLVALSLLLALAAALGPLYFHSRQILLKGSDQIRAQILLRTL